MSISLQKRSRLRFANLMLIDGYEFWDLLDLPVLAPKPDDLFYPVQATDRADLIANKLYGDPTLWWLIAYANDLELIPTQLVEGMVLRCPSPQTVQTFFNKVVQ